MPSSACSFFFLFFFFFLMIRRPPRSTLSSSSAASDVYKRQHDHRPPRPARLRTRAPPGRPPHQHHRPLVEQPHPALRNQLTPCPEPVAWVCPERRGRLDVGRAS